MDVDEAHAQFARMLVEHEPVFMRYVLTKVPNRADARDIVQECSVALWREFSKYDSERPFVAWALGFLRIEVLRFLRKSHRRAQLTESAAELLMADEQSHETALDDVEGHLEHCLETLPPTHREILDGYYHKEFTVSELSEKNGRTEAAIYKLLQRIRLALHDCIESQLRKADS